MAVASFQQEGREPVLRGFAPPKTASLTHWYKAAVGQIEAAPLWRTIPSVIESAEVTEDTITFDGGAWVLFVARKRFMK